MSEKNFVAYGDAETLFAGIGNKIRAKVEQVSTMPVATSSIEGKVVQFIGTTDTYTHGYFYECKQNGGTYAWVNVPVSAGGSGGHTILNGSGSAMTQRSKLQFDGLNVTDDSGNDKTVVKSPIFNGTTAQWEALSSAEKAKYSVVNLTDDYGIMEEIGRKTGTTSLSSGYQRLPSLTLSKTWTQISEQYRYIIILQLIYSSAQGSTSEFGNYFPAISSIYPTSIRHKINGNTYIGFSHVASVATGKLGNIQITIDSSDGVNVDLMVADTTSTTYNTGFVIYGIK